MLIHVHQTHITLGDFLTIKNEFKKQLKVGGLHLFPRNFLTGLNPYGLRSLYSFRSDAKQCFQEIVELVSKEGQDDAYFIFGGFDDKGDHKLFSLNKQDGLKVILENETVKLANLKIIINPKILSKPHDLAAFYYEEAYFFNQEVKQIEASLKAINKMATGIILKEVGFIDGEIYSGGTLLLSKDGTGIKKLSLFKEDSYTYEALSSFENSYQKNDFIKEAFMALTFSLKEFSLQNKIKKISVALSGGMDSSLVLALLKLSLKDEVEIEALYLPSIYSSSLSFDLSLELCQNLGIKLHSLPIKFLHSTAKNLFSQHFPSDEFSGLTEENIQARIRALILYTRANQSQSIAINCSNKSELLVGYSTQYGDSVGAISPLGDLYKTEVYALAHYINTLYKNIIPEKIITRAPSAELRPDQKDQDSLPPYEELDQKLEKLINGLEIKDAKIHNLYINSEFKRKQFCPIIKLTEYGLRNKITMPTRYYKN